MDRFLAAPTAGDVQGLMDVLGADVGVVADSGGLIPPPVVPSRAASGWPRRRPTPRSRRRRADHHTVGQRHGGARIDPGGESDTAITVVVEDGRTTRRYAMRNPHELGRLDAVAELRR